MQLGRVVIKGHPIYNGVVREDAVLEIPVPEELHILALDRGPDWSAIYQHNQHQSKNCTYQNFY